MPDPGSWSDRPARGSITRRQGLVGLASLGALGVLAACSSTPEPEQTVAPTTPPTVSPDAEALANEHELIARYDATLATFPAIAAILQPIRDQHAQHAAALGGAASPDPTSSGPTLPALPTDTRAAVGALIDAERSAMRQRISACVAASAPETARLLTFIAASEGSHIPALKDAQP
jgi:hypothetical protein